mmetsp:Transcript_22607/g.46900  ORF Transcript_22607/g.46900 Transcript_22607/m.46900 type:complete len:134 (-) Transcript_22607:239-640(-)
MAEDRKYMAGSEIKTLVATRIICILPANVDGSPLTSCGYTVADIRLQNDDIPISIPPRYTDSLTRNLEEKDAGCPIFELPPKVGLSPPILDVCVVDLAMAEAERTTQSDARNTPPRPNKMPRTSDTDIRATAT